MIFSSCMHASSTQGTSVCHLMRRTWHWVHFLRHHGKGKEGYCTSRNSNSHTLEPESCVCTTGPRWLPEEREICLRFDHVTFRFNKQNPVASLIFMSTRKLKNFQPVWFFFYTQRKQNQVSVCFFSLGNFGLEINLIYELFSGSELLPFGR